MLKRIFNFSLLILCLFSIVSCKKDDDNNDESKVQSISVVSSTVPESIFISQIESEIVKIQIQVTYNDKTTNIPLSSNMISASDYSKLQTVGSHNIVINYNGCKTNVTLNMVEEIDNAYTAKIVYPDGTPVSGGIAVQWCSTHCLLPVVINQDGIARKEMDDDEYFIHIYDIPEGYTYNPNIYTTNKDNKHVVIKLDKISNIKEGNGSTSSPYVVEDGVYELSYEGSGRTNGYYFSYTAKESKTVTVYSAAVDKLATNLVDPYLGFIGATDDLPNFSIANADVSGNKDSKVDINFNYSFEVVAGETYYFLIFVSSATSYPAPFNLYIE